MDLSKRHSYRIVGTKKAKVEKLAAFLICSFRDQVESFQTETQPLNDPKQPDYHFEHVLFAKEGIGFRDAQSLTPIMLKAARDNGVNGVAAYGADSEVPHPGVVLADRILMP